MVLFVGFHLLVCWEMNVGCHAGWGFKTKIAEIGSSIGLVFPFITKSIIFLSIMVKLWMIAKIMNLCLLMGYFFV
jgi:hypothetical protein